VIVGGSVAKGIARDDSDVDAVFIASEDEWAAPRNATTSCTCPSCATTRMGTWAQWWTSSFSSVRRCGSDRRFAFGRLRRLLANPRRRECGASRSTSASSGQARLLRRGYCCFMPGRSGGRTYLRWQRGDEPGPFGGSCGATAFSTGQKWLLGGGGAPKPAELPLLDRVLSSRQLRGRGLGMREFHDWGLMNRSAMPPHARVGWQRAGDRTVEW
jgi:hypothetical protein